MLKKKQIVVVVSIVAVMGYLISQPVKGLVKAQEENTDTAQKPASSNVDLAYVSEAAKPLIGAAATGITELEAKLKVASDDQKLTLQKELAGKWDDVNQPGPGAFYYQEIAQKENTYKAWLTAGEHFNDAFKFSQDTLARPAFLQRGAASFKNALKLDPESLEAKTGLGIANVNGAAASPMEGISLLLEVVKRDPNNRNANLNLGLFSMKSGQYDKAVERFKTVIAQKAEVEPYFYLAESYKQLGQKEEAIKAYEQCKSMMSDPAFTQRIDEFIKELKN
ncbi:MAG: tetratricopeptide repeat protein [Sphingobacteriaceae bacterium]